MCTLITFIYMGIIQFPCHLMSKIITSLCINLLLDHILYWRFAIKTRTFQLGNGFVIFAK